MAQKICDKKPCDELMVALRTYLHPLPPTNPDAGFVAIKAESRYVLSKRKTYEEKTDFVTLRYCPFCGTRIGYGMTEWIGPPPITKQVPAAPRPNGVKSRRI